MSAPSPPPIDLTAVTASLAQLSGVMTNAADILAARFSSLGNVLDGMGQTLAAASSRIIGGFGAVLGGIIAVRPVFTALSTAWERVTADILHAIIAIRNFQFTLTNVMGAVGAGVTVATTALGAAFGALTASFVRSIPAMVTAVAQLAPGLTNVLGQSFRDLQATVGQAFLPVIEIFIDVINNIAGIINPVMQRLAPLFATLAHAIGGMLIAAVQALAAVIEAMMPVLRIVAALFEAIGAILRAAILVIAAMFKALGAAFGDNLQDALDKFVDAAKWAASQLMLLAARIAAAFGGRDFVKALIDALENKETKGQRAALQGGAVSDFAALTHAMAASSVAARGVEDIEAKKDYDKQTVDQLKKIFDTIKPWAEKSQQEKGQFLKELSDLPMGGMGQAIDGAIKAMGFGGK